MFRFTRHMVGVAVFTLIVSSAHNVWAVSPNPLENAYWRFDDPGATANSRVAGGNIDVVRDSINQNHLRAQDAGTAPKYVADVAPAPLKSGLANNLAFNFSTADDGIHDDLYTDTKHINNGQIGGTHAPDLTGFTIEAAFRPSVVSGFQGIVGREGQPAGPIETLEMKIRGDTNVLQVEQYDRAGNLVQVSSQNQMVANNWYYVAVVNDGSHLNLYLDSNDGNGYKLQNASLDDVAVNGALYQGGNAEDWDKTWSVGRGYYNGSPADWFTGDIDEVRVSNRALSPSEFLFSPQGEYNGDTSVDAADFVSWRKSNVFGDNGYTLWRKHFGDNNAPASALGGGPSLVPEPASILIAAIAFVGASMVRRGDKRGSHQP